MIPTLGQIADHCRRAYLGDTEIPGGGAWKDSDLLGTSGASPSTTVGTSPIASAYSALLAAMRLNHHRGLRRPAYFPIPALTKSISLSEIGRQVGSPIELYERELTTFATPTSATLSSVASSGTTAPYLQIVFASPHSFLQGQYVQLSRFQGLSDAVNDEWCISVPNSTTIRLNGCLVDPSTWTASSGVVMQSNSPWPMNPIPQASRDRSANTDSGTGIAAATSLSDWEFAGGRILIQPLAAARQGKLIYELSASCPTSTSDTVGVPDSMEFMACYTAATAIAAKGMSAVAARIFMQATGKPDGSIGDGNQGLLGALIRPEVQSQQLRRLQIPRFRPRRNTGPINPY